jgi:hypothetical protein
VPERAPRGGWAWAGFLGSTDRRIASWPRVAKRKRHGVELDAASLSQAEAPSLSLLETPSLSLADALALIEPRNLAGLGDPAFGRRIPVDLEALVRGARKLGLTQREARRRTQYLRGWKPTSPAAV